MGHARSVTRYIRLFGWGFAVAAAFALMGEYRSSLPGPVPPLEPWVFEDELGMSSDSLLPSDSLELSFVYVGSSTCPACNVQFLPGVMDRLKRQVAVQAVARGWKFTMVGVARDMSPSQGLSHLEGLGPFHEVTSGRGWLNMGVQRYVFSTFPGRAATPQVILLLQEFDRRSATLLQAEVLARKIGNVALKEWAAQGARFPEPTSLGR